MELLSEATVISRWTDGWVNEWLTEWMNEWMVDYSYQQNLAYKMLFEDIKRRMIYGKAWIACTIDVEIFPIQMSLSDRVKHFVRVRTECACAEVTKTQHLIYNI